MLTAKALRNAGFEVSSAADSEQALERFEGHNFDVLVSDVILPGMSGVELAQRFRQRSPSLRVLLISGYMGDTSVEHEQVLAKPYTPDSLLTAIEHVLAKPPQPHTRGWLAGDVQACVLRYVPSWAPLNFLMHERECWAAHGTGRC